MTKNFKDFGIKTETKQFIGDKIKLDKVLNKEIIVHAFKIGPSKYNDKGNKECLHLQIEFKDEKHVLFSGSGNLMNMIKRVHDDCFPFKATIVKNSEMLEFT